MKIKEEEVVEIERLRKVEVNMEVEGVRKMKHENLEVEGNGSEHR